MPTTFSSLVTNGGFVSEISVEIVRKYPMIYSKSDHNGATTFISEKAEEKRAKIQNGVEQKAVEEIYNEVQKEFEKKITSRDSIRTRRSGKTRMTDKQIR
jgi:hypothetical protein